MLVSDGNWRDDLGVADVQCRQVGAGGQYKGVSFIIVWECMRESDGGACEGEGLKRCALSAWEGVGHGSKTSWGFKVSSELELGLQGSERTIMRKPAQMFRAY